MTALRQLISLVRAVRTATAQSASVFLRDVGHGLLEVSHNMLALVGLVLVAAVLFGLSHGELRRSAEMQVLGWLQARQELHADAAPAPSLIDQVSEPDAVARATASDPKELNRQQAAVANWLSRRYRVAPEPISRLVQEAWSVGDRAGLDPTLILAIMAIESSFNPFAQSPVGAQGLMQVMTKVHDDKYNSFGGVLAAFDPVTNLRVGVLVLKECISRAGSLEAGLRFYVGAANMTDDGGYAGKVLAEQIHLRSVASGKTVSPNVLSVPVAVASAASANGIVDPATAPAADAPAAAPATPKNGDAVATEKVALLR